MAICPGECMCMCVFGSMLGRERERERDRETDGKHVYGEIVFVCEKMISKIEGKCKCMCLCDHGLLVGVCVGYRVKNTNRTPLTL